MRKTRTLLAITLFAVTSGTLSHSQEVSLSMRKENGKTVVTLNGAPGTIGTLSVSDDLRSWQTLGAFTLLGGTASVTDDGSSSLRQRFYSVGSQGPIVSLPDLATMQNSVFVPGEGFDTVQYAPNGKLGLIVWKERNLILRERSASGSWSESTITAGAPAADLSPRLLYTPFPAAVLLYDSASAAHVFKASGNSVQHFVRSGGSWQQSENISSPGTVSRLTAAIAPDNTIHLGLHVSGSLVHATSRNGWNWTTVDSVQADPQWMPGSYSRRWLSLAVDSRGAAHFVYRPTFDFSQHPQGYRRAYTKLKYASNRSGAWAHQIVREPDDISGEVGSGQSIAIGPNDLPAIASWYNERGDGGSSQWSRLQFYEMNASQQWVRSEVTSRPIGYIAGDGEKGAGAYPYLRFDSRGRPHIVFTDHASQHFPYQNEYAGHVRHAVRNGLEWSVETLLMQDKPLEQQALFPAFAVNSSELALVVLERLTAWNTQANPQVATSTYKIQFLTRGLN